MRISFFLVVLLFGAPVVADGGPRSLLESRGATFWTSNSYKIKDSGYEGRNTLLQDLYWIDNQTILFIGGKVTDLAASRHTDEPYKLYVWSPARGDAREVHKESGVQSVCFRSAFVSKSAPTAGVPIEQGYVRFVVRRNESARVHFGRLFSERDAELDVQSMKDGRLQVNPLSCREYSPKALKERYGENVIPLVTPGEYLEWTNQDVSAGAVLRYFRAGSEQSVKLSIPYQDVHPTPRYSEFVDRYVFWELRARFGPDIAQRYWLLDRSGQVETYTVPAGPWMQGSTYAMPVRGGWFLISTASTNQAGGAYMISTSGVLRLVAGWPQSFAVSPDGCGVAISIRASDSLGKSAPKIKAINLCTE